MLKKIVKKLRGFRRTVLGWCWFVMSVLELIKATQSHVVQIVVRFHAVGFDRSGGGIGGG